MASAQNLGDYLKHCRARLDPLSLGFPSTRRRTPGLRREEVAQRANISSTWYTWLEQGRGGFASEAVLEQLARALMLTDVEREHLFLLGRGTTPGASYAPSGEVTPRLQRLLDALDTTPAFVRTPTWDVIAWNRAAAAVLTDYGALPSKDRNILRLLFLDARAQDIQFDWEETARFVVGVFRADAVRAGATERARPLVEELLNKSPDFAAMWMSNDVRAFGEGLKRLRHPILGEIEMEYSAFTVDGRPDLALTVYNPTDEDDRMHIATLLQSGYSAGPRA